MVSGSNKKHLANWHFVTPERLKEIDQIWRTSGSVADLGKFMHAFQDTFSHKGLGPGIGQVGTRVDENGEVQRDSIDEAEWHQVDDPSRRPELAKDMAKQSYEKLVEAAKIIYQKKPDTTIIYPAVGWESIAKEVADFCTDKDAKSREARADKLAQRLEANQRKLKPLKF